MIENDRQYVDSKVFKHTYRFRCACRDHMVSLAYVHDRLTSSSRVMNGASLSRAPHKQRRHANCNAVKPSAVRTCSVIFP